MLSEQQPRIQGFSRLLVEQTTSLISNPPMHDYSGMWISKCRNWFISPTSGRGGYQLIAVTQDAGIRMMHEFNDTTLIGTLEFIVKNLSKIGMYITEKI